MSPVPTNRNVPADSDPLIAMRAKNEENAQILRSMEASSFNRGDMVIKVKGTVSFAGVVEHCGPGLNGTVDMVVRCTVPGASGLKHIYRPDQFRKMTAEEVRILIWMQETWAMVWPTGGDA